MPYHGLASKKDAEAFLGRAVGIGHALVLPQVLAPGYDEEDFAVDGWVCRVLVDGPAIGSVASALCGVRFDRLDERHSIGTFGKAIFDINHHRGVVCQRRC